MISFYLRAMKCNILYIQPQKMERHFKIFLLAQLECEFAWICESLQASCIQHFKDMPSKI